MDSSHVAEGRRPTRTDVRTAERWCVFFLFALPLVSATWVGARAAGVAPFLAIPALIGAVALLRYPFDDVAPREARPPAIELVIVTIIALAPAVTMTALLFGGDFPFLGDSDYHLAQSGHAARFWMNLTGIAVALCVGAWMATRQRRSWWLVASMSVLVPLAGFFVTRNYSFPTRYPGAFYFFASPLTLIPWAQPLDALRVLNVLALPAWLLVLRPWIVGVFPRWGVLPLVLLLFWQKDIVYYLTSGYLEPWMLILLLLAIELAVRGGEEHAWKVLLLIGAGAMVKEQAILVLPFVAAALWLESAKKGGRTAIALAAAVAAGPFFVYLQVRRATGIVRTFSGAGIDDALTSDRLRQLGAALLEMLGAALPVAIALVIAACLLAIRERRVMWGALLAAAVFQIAFFFVDHASMAWTGYQRFHLVALVLLAAPFFALAAGPARPKWRLIAVASAAVALLQAVPLTSLLRNASDPPRLNSFEMAPVYYPVREAIRNGEQSGLLRRGERLRVVTDLDFYSSGHDPAAFAAAYPELRNRATVEPPARQACSCDAGAPLLALFTFPSEYSGPRGTEPLAFAARCRTSAAQSCDDVMTVEREGFVVALIGSKRAKQ